MASYEGSRATFDARNIRDNEMYPLLPRFENSPPLVGRIVTTSDRAEVRIAYFSSAGPERLRAFIRFADSLIPKNYSERTQSLNVINPRGKVGPDQDIDASILKWESPDVREIFDKFSKDHCDAEYPGMDPGNRDLHIEVDYNTQGVSFVPSIMELKVVGAFDPFISISLSSCQPWVVFSYLTPGTKYVVPGDGKERVVDENGTVYFPFYLFV